MELSAETKIMDLVEEYPWMIDFLSMVSPKLRRIRIPAQREKMRKTATIEIASAATGLTVEKFIELLEEEIYYRETGRVRGSVDERVISVEKVELDVGTFTQKELNLVLKHLPFDFTFVDADDKVQYYSGGNERIFPRTPSIIGRDVSRCHPEKSVYIVNNIVKAFKDGTRDSAEFWFSLGDRFIHIKYFAVRDEDDVYRGTVEVSQDITGIRELEGEQRLLDWTL